MSETLTLRTPRRSYVASWTDFDAGRSLDRCVSDFNLTMTDPDFSAATFLQPMTPAVLLIGPDPVLTGYIDSYAPHDRADAARC